MIIRGINKLGVLKQYFLSVTFLVICKIASEQKFCMFF